jgi:hypothetical protein
MTNTLDVARGSGRQSDFMARQQRRWYTPGPRKELTADSTALICVKSDMLTTTTNTRSTNTSMEFDHEKKVDLVDNRPLIVFWKSLSLSSPRRAKSNNCPLQDRVPNHQLQRTRAVRAPVTRLRHQVSLLQTSLRVKLGRL